MIGYVQTSTSCENDCFLARTVLMVEMTFPPCLVVALLSQQQA